MEIRKFQKEDHPMVCSWWKAHSWPLIPIEMLPTTGVIVDDVAAGFLYKTDSKIAWIEFIVTDPVSDKAHRSEALDKLISSLSEEAKSDGYALIFTSVEHPKLLARNQEHGFAVTDTNMTNMIKRL